MGKIFSVFNNTENTIAICLFMFFAIATYLIIRGFKVEKNIEKIKEKRYIRYIVYIIFFICLIALIITIKQNVANIIERTQSEIKSANEQKEIDDETAFYKNKMKETYNTDAYKNPYIPSGFHYVQGDYKSGFVIEDENENQYVWIPCTNQETEDSAILRKSNFGDATLFDYVECNDKKYEDFISSALKNGGYYISRYEIGQEGEKPVSKQGADMWKDLTYNEAELIIEEMNNDNNDVCIEIINGYGWDTAYAWILKNNSVQKYYYNKEKDGELCAGRVSYSNIYDMTDNILEITQERYYNRIIVRGHVNVSKEDNDYKQETRYTVYDEYTKRLFESEYLAIRTVLYKK